MQEIDIFVFMKYQQHADLRYLAITSIKICSSIVNFFTSIVIAKYRRSRLRIYSTLQVYQRSYSQVRHIPLKMSDKFESRHSLSPTIWSDIMVVVGRESGYLKIFFYISRGEHVKHFVIDAYL